MIRAVTPTEPILYSFRRCPYAMRARMALRVSGTACEIREVKLSAKPAAMLAASPKGTVPVLVLADGQVIDESLDIMRWALARNDPEGWLEGDDPALIQANDGPFKQHLDRYKYPDRHDSVAAEHRALGLEMLADLDRRLASSAYLCGELADERQDRGAARSAAFRAGDAAAPAMGGLDRRYCARSPILVTPAEGSNWRRSHPSCVSIGPECRSAPAEIPIPPNSAPPWCHSD
jgi:glutaredoxin